MVVRNTMLVLDPIHIVKQDIRGVLRILDDPESMALALEQRDSPAKEIAHFLWDTKPVMDQYCSASPWFCFEPELRETAVIHYTNDAGIGILLHPPSVEGYNGNGPEISPAFISDGFSKLLDQSRDNVFVYIVENFTVSEQLEILHSILRWYRANFLAQNGNGTSRISRCVKDFCNEIQGIINSEASRG